MMILQVPIHLVWNHRICSSFAPDDTKFAHMLKNAIGGQPCYRCGAIWALPKPRQHPLLRRPHTLIASRPLRSGLEAALWVGGAALVHTPGCFCFLVVS